jgi:hypothetical protein
MVSGGKEFSSKKIIQLFWRECLEKYWKSSTDSHLLKRNIFLNISFQHTASSLIICLVRAMVKEGYGEGYKR